MLHIALCDDERAAREEIKSLLSDYEQNGGVEMEIQEYESAEDLLGAVRQGVKYDFFLLDIYMNGLSGMKFAQELRQMNIQSPLIFLTTSEEHALEAFGVNAAQYLVKPLRRETFFAAIDLVCRRTAEERRQHVLLKADGGYRSVPVREILFSEARDKLQYIALADGTTLAVRMTVAGLFELLSPFPGFVRCGSPYILNLACVQKLDFRTALLSNGIGIPIPRGAYADLKKSFFDFFFERQE